MTEGQPAAECWLGGTAPVAFQADTPRGVRSVPGQRASTPARLHAPGGKAPTLGYLLRREVPTAPLTFDCEWASGRSATPARLAPQRPRSRSVGPTSTTGRAPASDKSRS